MDMTPPPLEIQVIDQLSELHLKDKISEESYTKIRLSLHQDSDFVSVLKLCAREELDQHHFNATIHILKALLDFLMDNTEYPNRDSILLDTIIAFVQLVDGSHNFFCIIKKYLEIGLEISIRLNDLRKQIVIILNLGYYYYVSRYPEEGYRFFSKGLDMADKLGDRDILLRTEYHRGLFNFFQGNPQQAITYFERVLYQDPSVLEFLPIYSIVLNLYFAYISAGDFFQGINLLKFNIKQAEKAKSCFSVQIFRPHLCWGLLLSGNMNEASKLFDELEEEGDIQDDVPFLPIKYVKTYYWYLKGDYKKAHQVATEVGLFMEKNGIRRLTYPWFDEIIYCFMKHGFDPIPGYGDFDNYIAELINGQHIVSRGIAWRIKAQDCIVSGEKLDTIWKHFKNSERDLKTAGSRIELAKTRAEMALFKLKNNEKGSARRLAILAWSSISMYENLSFPEELLPLIYVSLTNEPSSAIQDLDIYTGFLDILSNLEPSDNRNEFFSQLLSLMARFFVADNGCIFEFSNKTDTKPSPVRSFNLDISKTSGALFQKIIQCVNQTYKSQKPNILGIQEETGESTRALFVPLRLKKEFSGVLYIGNVFENSNIACIDETILIRLLEYLTRHVNKQWSLFIDSKTNCRSAISRATNSIRVFENSGSFYYGKSNQLTDQANRLASSDATILILGETGVGKTHLAHLLHDFSNRKEMPFINVNISGLPENLIESELFGHEKGAFTGANKQKPGMIELANKGTLFIDEVGDIPKSIQVKLLRVIEEKTVVRVGGVIPRKIDFRLIAATNRDLVEDVENGEFREDLYYRLSVVPLTVPPLRERENEIIEFANNFLSYYAKKYRIPIPQLSSEDEITLRCYHWPGNIRELKNAIEQAVLLRNGNKLQFQIPRNPKTAASQPETKQTLTFDSKLTLDEIQRQYIRQVLAKTGGQIGGENGAAKILGMKRTTLYNRMEKLGMRKSDTPQLAAVK